MQIALRSALELADTLESWRTHLGDIDIDDDDDGD